MKSFIFGAAIAAAIAIAYILGSAGVTAESIALLVINNAIGLLYDLEAAIIAAS
jgi:hypothetical protein